MDHLIISLPPSVVDAAADADPGLTTYIRRTPLGWWSLLGGPLLGLVATSAGPLAVVGMTLAGSTAILGLFAIGHFLHRKSVLRDNRTADVQAATALVSNFNALAPRLGALISHPPPDTADLFSQARQLRMDIQGLVGVAKDAVHDQPRLGQTGPRRPVASPMLDPRRTASEAQSCIEALAERLADVESWPPGVLRFPKRA